MKYPIQLEECPEGGYFVSFPDIPEALTQGETREESLAMGLDALLTSFEFYFEDGRKIPLPSEVTGDFVQVPLSVMAKIIMLNEFIDSGMSQVELAGRLGTTKQEVQRIINLKHSTKIDRIDQAVHALGKNLELVVAR